MHASPSYCGSTTRGELFYARVQPNVSDKWICFLHSLLVYLGTVKIEWQPRECLGLWYDDISIIFAVCSALRWARYESTVHLTGQSQRIASSYPWGVPSKHSCIKPHKIYVSLTYINIAIISRGIRQCYENQSKLITFHYANMGTTMSLT